MTVVLVGGGVRSGKSQYALERAASLGVRRRFVATAQAFDAEMEARIAAHRADRDPSFETVEEPLALPDVLAASGHVDVVLVDCLTLWLSNLLVRGDDDAAVARSFDALERALEACPAHVVLVTNEVGLGIVPEHALARRFRDHAGSLHQRLARRADEVHVGLLGVLLRLKPGPVVPSPRDA